MDAGAGVDVGALIGDLADAADVVVEGERAPVDTATAVVDVGAGLRPRCSMRDLLFPGADDDDEEVDGGLMGDAAAFLPFEGGGFVDDVVSVVAGVDLVGASGAFDTAAAVGFRLHDG